jgi:Carboxyltransferase domain, subdomain A and B
MALFVIDAGLSTTVQDEGRPGYREWGVPQGGAFDRGSAELANALLGNRHGCAVLEFTLLGGIYQADCPMALALAGAPIEAKIVGPKTTERLLQLPSSFSLAPGDRLILGRNLAGARTYLAVKGGWQTAAHPKSAFGRVASCLPSRGRSPLDDLARHLGGPRPTSLSASSRVQTADLTLSWMRVSGLSDGFESARRATGWACVCKATP